MFRLIISASLATLTYNAAAVLSEPVGLLCGLAVFVAIMVILAPIKPSEQVYCPRDRR